MTAESESGFLLAVKELVERFGGKMSAPEPDGVVLIEFASPLDGRITGWWWKDRGAFFGKPADFGRSEPVQGAAQASSQEDSMYYCSEAALCFAALCKFWAENEGRISGERQLPPAAQAFMNAGRAIAAGSSYEEMELRAAVLAV